LTFAEFMSALTALSLHRREKQAMLVGKVMDQLQKRLSGDKERASADDIRAACKDAGHGSIDIGVLSPAGKAGALMMWLRFVLRRCASVGSPSYWRR